MLLPAQDLRSNIGTWAVSTCQAPAVASIITDAYPSEKFDPSFQGQDLETVYFDTRGFALRKERARSDKYLTLRIRCYSGPLGAGLPTPPSYALSAKSESQKFRVPIDPSDAEAAISGNYTNLWSAALPGDLLARLLSIAGDDPVLPVVQVCCRRYAVESQQDRFTFDLGVTTDTGKKLGTNVLEFKSTSPAASAPAAVAQLAQLGVRPMKLSKFLWATMWR
jgi:hypothetical protein